MPKCKNCGTRLTKFDKDICPVCGTKFPFGNDNAQTVDITSEIDINNPDFKEAVPRTRKKTFIYFSAFGFTGYPFYYIRMRRFCFIWLAINLALIVGASVGFSYLTGLIPVGILIGIGISYIINILIGVFYLFFPDLRDGSGEFIL